jgi:F-type H+-transporting ATPase subunit epsilon
MNLEIVTPRKVIKENDVDVISLMSTEGSLGILEGHMPLLAELEIAPLYYSKGQTKEFVAVMGGVVRVLSGSVTVLTEDAERATEIDVLMARKEKEAAEAYLTQKAETIDMLKAEVQLRRALVRLKVAGESNK